MIEPYDDDGNHTSEALAYLKSLDTRVGKAARVSRNPEGQIVRVEVWESDNNYINLLMPGWLDPA